MSASVAVQFSLIPNFNHLAFSDEASIDEAVFHVLNVRKRKDPERVIAKTIFDQMGCKTVADLRQLSDHDWKNLNIPAICKIYLKHLSRQAKRKDAKGPVTFLDVLQNDFNAGQPFDMTLYQNHLSILTAMGFTQEESMEALVITENKGIEGALEILFQQDKSVREKRREEAFKTFGRPVANPSSPMGSEQKSDRDPESLEKALENEKSRRLKLEFELQIERDGARKILYREYLLGLIAQDSISVPALEKLAQYRREHNITDEDHENVLRHMGMSVEKFDAMKNYQAKEKGDECVVCLDKPRSHVVMNCMHFCLCESCADKNKKSKAKCPICSEPVKDIVHIFT